MMQAQEPYAVLSNDNTTLTFYYDNYKADRNGLDIGPFDDATKYRDLWDSHAGDITTVVFDDSFADCTTLTSTASWFKNFHKLTSIVGISNLKTDNVTSMLWMFSGCSSLTSLDLSNFNTENVTNMVGMFEICSALTSLDLSNFNTEKVTNMNGMFYCCSGLTSLDVSSFNTANVTDMSLMFTRCSGLTSLDVSNFNTEKVETMSYMFWFCSGLTSLDLSSFNTDKVDYMRRMFHDCSGLTTIYAGSEWSTEHVANSSNMFSGCINLVGGLGTTYDENHIDGTYARVDGGAEEPGYLTYKKSLGIQGIRNNDSADAPAYTLSGQRITTPHKGISIVGGRKVVVR